MSTVSKVNKPVEAGLLVRIKGPDDLMHFDVNLTPHHHLACLKCGGEPGLPPALKIPPVISCFWGGSWTIAKI